MTFFKRLGYAALFLMVGYASLQKIVESPTPTRHSPEEVVIALTNLDIRKQPGEPGSTAEAAGGVLPEFRLTQSGNVMRWQVMSGDLVTMTMTAEVTEGWLWGSWIWAEVERGNAPDSLTSPAFQSEGITLGLFKNAISDTIDLIGSPGWGPDCDAIHMDLVGDQSMLTTVFLIRSQLLERGCDYAARPNDFIEVKADTDGAGPNAGNGPSYTIGEDGRRYDKDGDEISESGFKVVSPY